MANLDFGCSANSVQIVANTTVYSCSVNDLALASFADIQSTDKKFSVPTTSSLLCLCGALGGSSNAYMVYVESLNTHVISSDGRWWTLGGCLIRDDRTLNPNSIFLWGNGNNARLGKTSADPVSSPIMADGAFVNWCKIDAGSSQSIALRTDGTAWTWGGGSGGKLGDGTVLDNPSPVAVLGGFTNWCVISANYNHTVALRTDGTAWAWGCGTCGRLGDGTTVDKSSPISVIGGFTNWCAISAGFWSTTALRTDGTIWTWGGGVYGVLGDGTTVCKSSPVSVIGGFTDWSKISAGYQHVAALRTDGTAWAWGCNSHGQIGDCTTVNKSSPISVIGGFTNWCAISSGYRHTAAIRTDGTAWGWGAGFGGRLGNCTTVDKSSPVSVVGGFTNWCAISVGGFHTVAIQSDGTAWAWGCGTCGKLGDNTTVNKSSPVAVVGGVTTWCAISAGDGFVVALRT